MKVLNKIILKIDYLFKVLLKIVNQKKLNQKVLLKLSIFKLIYNNSKKMIKLSPKLKM